MSQAAADPIRLTVPMLEKVLQDRCPSVLPSFAALKDRLSDPESKNDLGQIIKLEVESEVLNGLTLFRWRGKQGMFQLEVPRPFEPNGVTKEPEARPTDAPTPAQEPQEAAVQPAVDKDTPEIEQGALSLQEPSPEAAPVQEKTPTPQPELEEPETPVHTRGLFVALAELLGDSTLLMTVAKTGTEGKEPVLTVTVVPQGEDDVFSPVCLEGTVSELDSGFVGALQGKAQSRKALQEQVEALKAADKELEEAKRKEAEAKRKQAENKKKAAEKKEGQPKEEKEAAAEAPKPPAPPTPQEALF